MQKLFNMKVLGVISPICQFKASLKVKSQNEPSFVKVHICLFELYLCLTFYLKFTWNEISLFVNNKLSHS